jgi:enamine deaminase RidA (YjgF/YER057c/UK114 family)
MERTRIASGSPYESIVGFSRVVREGHHLSVAGTAPIMPEGVEPPTDAYGQAKRCFEIIEAALREAGAGPEHVIRTRVFLVNAADWEEVGRAHGELFADVRPVNTMVVVKGLLDDGWLLEVEADAIVD